MDFERLKQNLRIRSSRSKKPRKSKPLPLGSPQNKAQAPAKPSEPGPEDEKTDVRKEQEEGPQRSEEVGAKDAAVNEQSEPNGHITEPKAPAQDSSPEDHSPAID